MAALRAAGWRGRRPHPAGSRVARWTIAPPASLPAELPHRTTYPTNSLLTAARRRGWRVDAPSSAAKPVTSARRWNPVRRGGSRARTPGSRLPHRAQGVGGRMPPMLCNPRGPEGRNNKPDHHPDLHRGSRQDAGVDERIRHPCGSRRTRRRCANLNADTVSSARRPEHLRTKGAGHGCPDPGLHLVGRSTRP